MNDELINGIPERLFDRAFYICYRISNNLFRYLKNNNIDEEEFFKKYPQFSDILEGVRNYTLSDILLIEEIIGENLLYLPVYSISQKNINTNKINSLFQAENIQLGTEVEFILFNRNVSDAFTSTFKLISGGINEYITYSSPEYDGKTIEITIKKEYK